MDIYSIEHVMSNFEAERVGTLFPLLKSCRNTWEQRWRDLDRDSLRRLPKTHLFTLYTGAFSVLEMFQDDIYALQLDLLTYLVTHFVFKNEL